MSKVVPFLRSADYLHQRALKKRRGQMLLDALDLMRRALERGGDNAEYMLDMAELYCEMGCPMLSNQVLLRVLCSPTPLNECFFGMCVNFMSQNDLASAYGVLTHFLSNDPGAVRRGEVAEVLERLVLARELSVHDDRHVRRAARLSRMAQRHMRAARYDRAVQLLDKSLSIRPDARDARALLALALMRQGNRRAALCQLARLTRGAHVSAWLGLIVVRLLDEDGQRGRARRALRALCGALKDKDEGERAQLLEAACALDMHDLARDIALGLLRGAPYDTELLHIAAAALANLGHMSRAAALWERVRHIDPRDSVAAYYAAAAAAGRLGGPVRYVRDVPYAERANRARLLAEALSGGGEAFARRFAQSSRLRGLVRWALFSGEGRLQGLALGALASATGSEAEYMLREYLIWPRAGARRKRQALKQLRRLGTAGPFIVTGLEDGLEADQPPSPPAACHAVLRMAARGMQALPGFPQSELRGVWLRFAASGGAGARPIRLPAAWAGALVLCRWNMADKPVAVRLLSRVFGCSPRMVRRRARTIARFGIQQGIQKEDKS